MVFQRVSSAKGLKGAVFRAGHWLFVLSRWEEYDSRDDGGAYT
jgi:hypothetical protein